MKAAQRHSLVTRATLASNSLTEKSASCNPAQKEVLEAVLSEPEGTEKRASLARLLAAGDLSEAVGATA